MKTNKNNRLNAFKQSHKSTAKPAPGFETGIPNTDVLGMQQVNQGAIANKAGKKRK